jgi:putative FmdB family regulatory protein
VPLYEYQCKQCQHRFEKIQSFSAPEEKVCPECGGEVEKLISAPAIQFKGAGWYVNDYAGRNKAPSSAGSDNNSSKEGGSKDSGGKDVSAKSSESSSKNEGGKSDGSGKSDSGAASSNAGSSAASSSDSGSNTKSSS